MGYTSVPLDLGLEETDSIIELGCDVQLLICGCVSGADERGIVCGYLGDVSIAAIAEFDVVIAGRGVSCSG